MPAVGAVAAGAAAVCASASDTVSTVGAAASPNAAANPISERAFRREIVSDLMIALMSNSLEDQVMDRYKRLTPVATRREAARVRRRVGRLRRAMPATRPNQ